MRLFATMCTLLALCGGASGQDLEVKIRIRFDTDKDKFTVQMQKGKEWKEVINHQMAKLPSYRTDSVIVLFEHKKHDEFFPKKMRGELKDQALLIVVHQQRPIGLEIDPNKKKVVGVVIDVHSYQFVVSTDGKVLKQASSRDRHIEKAKDEKNPKKPDAKPRPRNQGPVDIRKVA